MSCIRLYLPRLTVLARMSQQSNNLSCALGRHHARPPSPKARARGGATNPMFATLVSLPASDPQVSTARTLLAVCVGPCAGHSQTLLLGSRLSSLMNSSAPRQREWQGARIMATRTEAGGRIKDPCALGFPPERYAESTTVAVAFQLAVDRHLASENRETQYFQPIHPLLPFLHTNSLAAQ